MSGSTTISGQAMEPVLVIVGMGSNPLLGSILNFKLTTL
jgi:hypothetical protein